MDLFEKLSEIMGEGSTVTMTVAKSGKGMTVSVMPGNSLVKDAAKSKFVPINVSGTPEELDEGFLDTILNPIAKANGLLTNKYLHGIPEDSRAARNGEEGQGGAEEGR